MPAERVCCLSEDSTGLLWMGTDEGLLSGLAVMDVSGRTIRAFEIQGIYNVAALSPAADGGLWVLNIEDRFVHIDVTTDNVTCYELTGEGVWLTDHAGNVWHGSTLGLDSTPHLTSEFAYWEVASGRQVTCLATTSEGSVWLGCGHELLEVDMAGVVRHHALLSCLPHALAADGGDRIWCTTAQGIVRREASTGQFCAYRSLWGGPEPHATLFHKTNVLYISLCGRETAPPTLNQI